MLDCPRCAAPLPLTLPRCACGADVPEAAPGVGLVCDGCAAWSPAGAPRCTACGATFGGSTESDSAADLPTIDLDLVADAEQEPASDSLDPERASDALEPERASVALEPERASDAVDREPASDSPQRDDEPALGRAHQSGHGPADERASDSGEPEREVVSPPSPATTPAAALPPVPAPATLPPPSASNGPPMLLRTGRARGAAIRQALPAAPARLRVASVRADGSSASVLLGDGAVLCGRSDADLLVPGDTVSRHHARFTARGGRAVVEDLGSLNGTWIRLRAPRAAAYGDELRVGDRRLRLAFAPGGATLEEIATGGATLAVHPLRPGTTVLGSDGDVRLDGLEPMHARLETTAAGYSVTDLGSRTGTWLRLAAPEPVAAGDEILLGAERLRVDEP